MPSNFRYLIVAGGLFCFAGSAAAEATPASSAQPGSVCLQAPQKLSDSDVQSFIVNPAALLAGGKADDQLADRVRELAGSSKAAFDTIAVLSKTATASQKALIAAGLARVVYTCSKLETDATQAYADAIQNFVASAGDPAFASTFQEALRQINVASVGPGAASFSVGGGATDAGSGKMSGTNSYKSPGDGPRDTTSGAYTFGDVNAYGAAADDLSPS